MRLWLRNTCWNWQREFNNLVVKITVAVKEKYSIVYKKLSKQKKKYVDINDYLTTIQRSPK